MEKPLFNWGSVLGRSLLIGCLTLSLTGCVDLEARVVFTSATTGTINGVYSLPWEVLGQTQRGQGKTGLLPESREGWLALLQPIPGMTLGSFTAEDRSEGRRITLTLSFTTLRALEGLFTALGHKLTVTENSGTVLWTFDLLPWKTDTWPPDLLTLLRGRWGSNELSFTVLPPRPIRTTSEGTLSPDNRSVTVTRLLSTLAAGNQAPAEWRMTW